MYVFYHIIFILFNSIHFSPSPVEKPSFILVVKYTSTFETSLVKLNKISLLFLLSLMI